MQHIEYVPFGEVLLEERNNKWNTPYLFNAKELDEEIGLYYYRARYYDPRVSLFYGVDPKVEETMTPYQYCYQNPVRFVDPTGMSSEDPSTDVVKNLDGSYTVTNAHNDGDNNIYVVTQNGKRTGEVIGQTTKPYDFLFTDDSTGDFYFDAKECGVTFSLNNLTASGFVKGTDEYIHHADKDALMKWGHNFLSDNFFKTKKVVGGNLTGILELAQYSRNGGPLDFKVSLDLPKYTAISAGKSSNGLPLITTLRAIGNELFGSNLRRFEPLVLTPNRYYRMIMPIVGYYNQKQNNGNGYNDGFPYYGEYTYSGSYIYKGFWGYFY